MILAASAANLHPSSTCVLSQGRCQTCLCIFYFFFVFQADPCSKVHFNLFSSFSHFSPVCSFWLSPPLWSLLHPSALLQLSFLLLHPFHHLRPSQQSFRCSIDTQPIPAFGRLFLFLPSISFFTSFFLAVIRFTILSFSLNFFHQLLLLCFTSFFFLCRLFHFVNRTPTHTACTDAHSVSAHHTAQSDHISSCEHAWHKFKDLCAENSLSSTRHVSFLAAPDTDHQHKFSLAYLSNPTVFLFYTPKPVVPRSIKTLRRFTAELRFLRFPIFHRS